MEKEWTLRVQLQLGKVLAGEPGLSVVFSRQSDVLVSPDARSEQANLARADIALSLHLCAAEGEVNTARVYFFAPAKTETMTGGEGLPAPVRGAITRWRDAQLPYREASNNLAAMLQAELNALFNDGRAEVRSANLYQLKRTALPAVLVEFAAARKQDGLRLLQEEFLHRVVQTLRDTLVRYLFPQRH